MLWEFMVMKLDIMNAINLDIDHRIKMRTLNLNSLATISTNEKYIQYNENIHFPNGNKNPRVPSSLSINSLVCYEDEEKNDSSTEISSYVLQEIRDEYIRGIRELEKIRLKTFVRQNSEKKDDNSNKTENSKATFIQGYNPKLSKMSTYMQSEKNEQNDIDKTNKMNEDHNLVEKLQSNESIIIINGIPKEVASKKLISKYLQSPRTLHMMGNCPCTTNLHSRLYLSSVSKCSYHFEFYNLKFIDSVDDNKHSKCALITIKNSDYSSNVVFFIEQYPLHYVCSQTNRQYIVHLDAEQLFINPAFDANKKNIGDKISQQKNETIDESIRTSIAIDSKREIDLNVSSKILAIKGILPEQFFNEDFQSILLSYGEIYKIKTKTDEDKLFQEDNNSTLLSDTIIIEFKDAVSANNAFKDFPYNSQISYLLGDGDHVGFIKDKNSFQFYIIIKKESNKEPEFLSSDEDSITSNSDFSSKASSIIDDLSWSSEEYDILDGEENEPDTQSKMDILDEMGIETPKSKSGSKLEFSEETLLNITYLHQLSHIHRKKQKPSNEIRILLMRRNLEIRSRELYLQLINPNKA